jgi:hypothetical protein
MWGKMRGPRLVVGPPCYPGFEIVAMLRLHVPRSGDLRHWFVQFVMRQLFVSRAACYIVHSTLLCSAIWLHFLSTVHCVYSQLWLQPYSIWVLHFLIPVTTYSHQVNCLTLLSEQSPLVYVVHFLHISAPSETRSCRSMADSLGYIQLLQCFD